MKIAIVDIGWNKINALHPEEGALGGSETWLVQISKAFAKYHKVDVYCTLNIDGILKDVHVPNRVWYNNANELDALSKNKYDFVILNRFFEKNGINYIEYLNRYRVANRIYIQMHDLSFIYNNELLPCEADISQYHLLDSNVSIVCLNEWHKYNLIKQYNALKDDIICIPDGVDLELFEEDIDTSNRDNRILWSSCEERGLDILVNDILPRVKAKVPDFGIDVASYNEPSASLMNNGSVQYLGKLSKKQLYTEQKKHKVWFYPGTFAETFCITMLENILNGCRIVSPMTYGMKSTLSTFYENMCMKYDFDTNKEKAIEEASQDIINILTRDKVELYSNSVYDFIRTKYNWNWSVDAYYDDYISRPCTNDVMQAPRYKCIFLSQYCNEQFFVDEEKLVEETWAKALIDCEIPGCRFFAYTSCDSEHPYPCIDGNRIYVKCDDDVLHTWTKTKLAYQLLQQYSLTSEFIFRTNTSCYINVHKVYGLINRAKPNEIWADWCGYYSKQANGETEFLYNMICGTGYLLHKSIADQVFFSDYNEDNIEGNVGGYKAGDDVNLSRVLNLMSINYESKDLGSYDKEHNTTWCKRYKSGDKQEELDDIAFNTDRSIDDPNVINNEYLVQYRTKYINLEERNSLGNEFIHARELHSSYVKENNRKHYKYLFLSMCCNEPFFKLEQQQVQNTWAKPIIEGKYGNDACYFCYYGSNGTFENDYNDGCSIYLNIDDSLHGTYDKTIRCLQYLIEQGYSWERLVRTNTSTYINADKWLEDFGKFQDNDVISNYFTIQYDSDIESYIAGWCFSLSWEMCKYLVETAELGKRENDDVMISLQLSKVPYLNYKNLGVWHYKCIPQAQGLLGTIKQGDHIFDKPEERFTKEHFKDAYCVQVRNCGIPEARYIEIESLQELDNMHKEIYEKS